MVDINTDNNNFKFTSFTPKVSASVSSLINGGIFNIDLSVDEETLKSDFVKLMVSINFILIFIRKMFVKRELNVKMKLLLKQKRLIMMI